MTAVPDVYGVGRIAAFQEASPISKFGTYARGRRHELGITNTDLKAQKCQRK